MSASSASAPSARRSPAGSPAPIPIPHLTLTHLCDRRARDKQARQTDALARLTWTDRFDDLLASDIDIVIETIPGSEPAVDYVRAALLAGKSVVTSNKQVIAHQGPALLTLAERQGRQLRFEAAVGGAMPIVRALGDGMAGDHVLRIEAILNGTSNVVLSQDGDHWLRDGRGDRGGLRRRIRGVAIRPRISTASTPRRSCAILCGLAFGVRVAPSAIDTKSTATIGATEFATARLRGGTIRQIAHAMFDRDSRRLEAWVAPTFVQKGTLFSTIVRPAQRGHRVVCLRRRHHVERPGRRRRRVGGRDHRRRARHCS